MNNIAQHKWSISSPEGRWAGFGPYYAMFPVSFAKEMIEQYSRLGDLILDPFCGRGTTNYVASATGRNSFGSDINPVGWVYTKTKTNPEPNPQRLIDRVQDLIDQQNSTDHIPQTEFQEWAWCADVLGYLNSARRNLNWRRSRTDWTLAAITMVHLHAKMGEGLSNQMRQSKAMAPDYSVRWWSEKNMRAPQIDPLEFFRKKIGWRYQKGFINNSTSHTIRLGDARKVLRQQDNLEADFLLTSPPYMGVTDYRYDNWIRLWFLGGATSPLGLGNQRHSNKLLYSEMMEQVFAICSFHLKEEAPIVVRTDKRPFTLDTTLSVVEKNWPNHKIFVRHSQATKSTQTALFGDHSPKPGEVDIIAVHRKVAQKPSGFSSLNQC